MQIHTFGTLYNTLKTMNLEMKWQRRKLNPLMAKGSDPNSELENLKRQAESIRKSNKISSIDTKLKSGQRLSGEELEYLRINSPSLYEKAIEVIKEREQYKRELENCKSKEDVSKLNEVKIQTLLTQANSITGNASLSAGEKQEGLDQIMRRLMGINNEHAEFLKTGKYAALPEKADDSDKKEKPPTIKTVSLNKAIPPVGIRKIYSANCENDDKEKKASKLSVKI